MFMFLCLSAYLAYNFCPYFFFLHLLMLILIMNKLFIFAVVLCINKIVNFPVHTVIIIILKKGSWDTKDIINILKWIIGKQF